MRVPERSLVGGRTWTGGRSGEVDSLGRGSCDTGRLGCCLGRRALLALSPVVLGAHVGPSMGLLHVLLAVAFSLGLIRAGSEAAFEQCRRVGMFIINVAVPFLFSGPSDLVVFAGRVGALPGA